MKPWARYDRAFVEDQHVQAMPARVRAAAYALLLAINGACYRRPSTGRLLALEVEVLAQKLGQKSRALLPVLASVSLVKLEGNEVVLPRFFEWNPELSEDRREARAEAGRIGAEVRWHSKPHSKPHSNSDGKPHNTSHSKLDGKLDGKIDARNKKEIERRSTKGDVLLRDKGLENNSWARTLLRAGPDPDLTSHAQVVVAAWEELVGRPATRTDIDTAYAWLTEWQRATGQDIARWIREAVEHNASQPDRTPAQTLRALNAAVKARYRHEADDLPLRSRHTLPMLAVVGGHPSPTHSNPPPVPSAEEDPDDA